jgi:hypothetical protein
MQRPPKIISHKHTVPENHKSALAGTGAGEAGCSTTLESLIVLTIAKAVLAVRDQTITPAVKPTIDSKMFKGCIGTTV